MKSLADAIVYAVVFIDLRESPDAQLDDDVDALVSITAYLRNSTEAEKNALAEAAERALAEERAGPSPRKDFIDSYKKWMEATFGDDEWRGNKRKRKRSGPG